LTFQETTRILRIDAGNPGQTQFSRVRPEAPERIVRMRRVAIGLGLFVVAGLPCAATAGDAEPAPGGKPVVRSIRFVGPRAGPERAAALSKYGGDSSTEKAVAAGLDWLARHQGDDGGWDADGFSSRCTSGGAKCEGVGKGQHGEEMACPFDAAISALCTLAFLGAGHGPFVEGDARGPVVEKALARLSRGQDAWTLPIATQAFAEAEALDGKGRWKEAAVAGAESLLRARGKDGGWGYASGFRDGSDVPYSGLVVPALVAARDVGVDLPATLGAEVDAWLGTLEEKNGRLAYLKEGRAYGYTPTSVNGLTAAAIRGWLGAGTSSKRHRAHLSVAAREHPVWKIEWKELEVPGRGKQRVQIGNLSLYAWWYGAMATFQAGGDAWSGYFGAAKSALLSHQRKDGCAKGSWDPEGDYERRTGGRVFATALAVMILETPYRHRRLN